VEDKQMQRAYGIDMMFREILPKLAHGNDGLIFTSIEGEYVCGTDEHMYNLSHSSLTTD
jgi:mRNA guanylyltransferase